MAKAIMPALDDLKSRIANTNQKLTSQYRMMQMAHHRYNLLFRLMHKTLMIHHFALLLCKNYLTIQVGTLQRIHHQYNRYESALDDTLIGIKSLSSGYLTYRILDPKILSRYLEAITDDMENTAPDYELVFTDVYTQILPKTEYIALTKSNYVPLMQAQISLCAKIGYMYYCEYAHLLKKCTEYTCMSAIYYDQSGQIKADKCKMIVTFDMLPESKILDASDILILSYLQKPWTIVCKDVNRTFDLEYSTYHILNRSELCECSLTAGNYLLSQTESSCGDMPKVKNGFFTT